MQAGLLGTLTGELCHTTECLALTLALLDLLQHDGGVLCVDVEVVVQLLAEEVIEELLYATSIGLHILGS